MSLPVSGKFKPALMRVPCPLLPPPLPLHLLPPGPFSYHLPPVRNTDPIYLPSSHQLKYPPYLEFTVAFLCQNLQRDVIIITVEITAGISNIFDLHRLSFDGSLV